MAAQIDFETDLRNTVVRATKQGPITVQAGGLIITGILNPQQENSPDHGRIIIDRARIILPSGDSIRVEWWECRADAVTGFSLGSTEG